MKYKLLTKVPRFILIAVACLGLLLIGFILGAVVAPQASLLSNADMAISNAFQPAAQKTTPSFWIPVSGVGEGISEAKGSIKHQGPDAYALDYVYQKEGVDVYPVLPGRIVYSGCPADYGCTVVVRHWDDRKWDRKYYSIYAHLQTGSLLPLGTTVDGTRPIGRMGKTGRGSNGIVHLHFAVRYSDQVYDGTTALYGKLNGVIVTPAFDVRPFLR